jgi:uncharacterized membrane protein
MKGNSKQEIELTLKPTAEAKEVSLAAHVSFEYGQAVTTKIDKPKLKVDKQVPEKVSQGERFPVRVIVANTGKVAIKDVKLTENISPTFQFVSGNTDGGQTETATQRIWKLGTISPGQQRVVEYFVKSEETKELLAQSIVSAAEVSLQEQARSTTKVLSSGFHMDLVGPQTINAGAPAKYEIKVTNTGSLPLDKISVSAGIPKNCELKGYTETGAKRYSDAVVWILPVDRESKTSGQRTIRVAATGPREQQQAREVKTNFEGSADLRWQSFADPVQVSVRRNGAITVKVKNEGSETARNVRLVVELPPEVELVQVSPKYRQNVNDVLFDAINLPANSQETYSITYRAIKATRSTTFKLKLFDVSTENDPLRKEQEIQINP